MPEGKVGNIYFDYDNDTLDEGTGMRNDVLYLSLGEPTPGLHHEKEPKGAGFTFLVGTDAASRITGVTIIGYPAFRAANDIAWVRNLGLPQELLDYILSKPEFPETD